MSRPVRFNVHPIPADIKEAVGVAEAPDGYPGEGFCLLLPLAVVLNSWPRWPRIMTLPVLEQSA